MPARYDTIGVDYANLRKPDPRIASVIHAALGDAESVLNVGAGAGSYEPADRAVTAVEPSSEMIRQRPASAAPVTQGFAEDLPFGDDSFDAAMAILTIHHWSDKAKGVAEMRRVSRGRVVFLTFDPAWGGGWLADYIPEHVKLDEETMPTMAEFAAWLGPIEVTPVPVPHDCSDGFLGAYWRRPAAYLDPRIQSGSSCFWLLDDIADGLARLERDLASGAWEEKYGALLALDDYDCGYRLVVAGA